LGFTTFEALDSLDDVLWNANFQALMLSYDQDSALDIFDKKVNFAWEQYPEELRALYKVDTDRANKLKFGFGDKTFSEIAVRSKGRSGTYNRVHISEMGKICKESRIKAKELITGTIPSVPHGGRIDIESTAEGEEGEFHDMFWEAYDRGEPRTEMEFKAHFYNWTWDEDEIAQTIQMEIPDEFRRYQTEHSLTDQQISYYYQKYLSLGSDWSRLKQEYPTTPEEAFVYSGVKMFDQEKLKWQEQFIKGGDKINQWTFFNERVPSHAYALGADVAEGIGQDSSTGVLIDFTPNPAEVVATYQDNTVAPDILAHELINTAKMYNNCLIAPERNNHGFATITVLKDKYANIYTERKRDKTQDKVTDKLGWHTNALTKPQMLYALRDAINEKLLIIRDRRLLRELRTYDQRDLSQIRFDEEQSKHWDLLIACAIAWQMKTEAGGQVVRVTANQNFDRFDL